MANSDPPSVVAAPLWLRPNCHNERPKSTAFRKATLVALSAHCSYYNGKFRFWGENGQIAGVARDFTSKVKIDGS